MRPDLDPTLEPEPFQHALLSCKSTYSHTVGIVGNLELEITERGNPLWWLRITESWVNPLGCEKLASHSVNGALTELCTASKGTGG
jgi:hypothetical protein